MIPGSKSLLIYRSKGWVTLKMRLFLLIISHIKFRRCGTASTCGETKKTLILKTSPTTGVTKLIAPRTVMGALSLLGRAPSRTTPRTLSLETAWSKSISRLPQCTIKTSWTITLFPDINSTLFLWDTVSRTPLIPETNSRSKKTRGISPCSRSSTALSRHSNSPFSTHRQTTLPKTPC